MGTKIEITALSKNIKLAQDAVDAAFNEILRIEKLISSWDSTSQTSAINKNAGIKAVKVDDELYQLIHRSISISELTNGIFDISYASLDKIWKFDGSMQHLPSDTAVSQSIAKIDYKNIELHPNNSSIFLKEKGMKIGFGAIGKGYAANKCKVLMQNLGIENGVVNAGGDLITWGHQANGSPWTIGIANPEAKNVALSWLEISDQAVVTSGNYERFIEFNGKKYCHIINPKTGWPAEALSSVTVICRDAEVADALATAVFILGVENGLALINQLTGIECFIVDDAGQLFPSENIEISYLED